ncbi:MAG: MotA/TolQ/ExbB proton channel family protein [Cyanobacteria bacterium]|nr:MotA/TolQ/ExbB proton channel family protein [Cyanobacteriota bacterium]
MVGGTGGWVMVPLVVLSLGTTTLIVERLWFWSRLLKQQRSLISTILDLYDRSPQAALTKLQQHQDSPTGRIFLAALTLPEATPDEFRLALESAAQGELPLLKRFSTIFETVVAIAPLLGLLGTILGLIRSLSSWQLGGAANAQSVAVVAGIGDALFSTAAGLTLAITTLIFANSFQGLYRRQRAFIQEAGGQLELLYRRQHRQFFQARRNLQQRSEKSSE